jgi:hypothetical protein
MSIVLKALLMGNDAIFDPKNFPPAKAREKVLWWACEQGMGW